MRRCWLLVISDDGRVEWLTLFKSLTVCGVKLVLHEQGDACWIAWKIVVSKVPLQHQQLYHVNVTCCMWSWQEKEECLFIVGVIQGSCKDARWLRWRWTERKVVFASCNAAALYVLCGVSLILYLGDIAVLITSTSVTLHQLFLIYLCYQRHAVMLWISSPEISLKTLFSSSLSMSLKYNLR